VKNFIVQTLKSEEIYTDTSGSMLNILKNFIRVKKNNAENGRTL
jgi:hypothetical protein